MEQTITNGGLSYFRIKTKWLSENVDGTLSKRKTEEIVMATSYTEAETIAYEIAQDQNRGRFENFTIDIIRTNISDILYNDILCQDETLIKGCVCNFFRESVESGVGLYSVKVLRSTIDEKTGKEKTSTQTLYIPAESNADATNRIIQYLGDEITMGYTIRDTRFDNAEAIYWPEDIHNNKVSKLC